MFTLMQVMGGDTQKENQDPELLSDHNDAIASQLKSLNVCSDDTPGGILCQNLNDSVLFQ